MSSIQVLIGIVLGLATVEWGAAIEPLKKGFVNTNVNCIQATEQCNCSKFGFNNDKGVCLPGTGNYSIFLPCTSLDAVLGIGNPANCADTDTWTMETRAQYWYNNDSHTTVQTMATTGGLWVHYNYTKGEYVNKTTGVTIQVWYLHKNNQRSQMWTFSVLRHNGTVNATTTEGGRTTGVSIMQTKSDLYFRVRTGITGETNNWLAMVEQVGQAQGQDCIVCMGPRPPLRIVPAAVCAEHVLMLMNSTNFNTSAVQNCSHTSDIPDYDLFFPHVPPEREPPLFHAHIPHLNFICVKFTGARTPRKIPSLSVDRCTVIKTVNPTYKVRPRADIWWWCGGLQLFDLLPKNTSLLCALVSLIMPAKIYPLTGNDVEEMITTHELKQTDPQLRTKRSANWMGDNDPTYIDGIGIPRGVPDEYKLADQVAAGFENIPILSAIFPITPNKNVDRINFIHYNVQRLGNFTLIGFEAIHEQLSATSLMAFQNRIALDMLLAERGGVCSMFPDGQCCTFIPNNTQSGGKLTKVLDGLKAFNKRLKEQSGITNPWDKWFLDHFGKYKGLVQSVLLSLAVFAALLTMCGCCCIPCIRALIQRVIDRAVTPEEVLQHETVHLLVLDPDNDLSDDDSGRR